MNSATNHVDAATSSASAGVDGGVSEGDKVCSLSDKEFKSLLDDAITFNRPLSEASPLYRSLLDRNIDDDDVTVSGTELRTLNADCSQQRHNPRHRRPPVNLTTLSGAECSSTLDANGRGAAARTTQGGSLQNLHVRPSAPDLMGVGGSSSVPSARKPEEVDTTVNFFKPCLAVKSEESKPRQEKRSAQCLSSTGPQCEIPTLEKWSSATEEMKSNQTRRMSSREVVSDEGCAPKQLDENGNPLGLDSRTHSGNTSGGHVFHRVGSASDVHLESGHKTKGRKSKTSTDKQNVTTAEKIPGHFWDNNIEVMVKLINSVGSGLGKKGRSKTPGGSKQMVNGQIQQQHEAEEDADAEEEDAERKPRKKEKVKSKRHRMDTNDRWSRLSDNSSASEDAGVVSNNEDTAADQDLVDVTADNFKVPCELEPLASAGGDASSAFRSDFYSVAVANAEIPPCLEDDFHVVTAKRHRRRRSANQSGGGNNPGSSSSSVRGRARTSDPGERRTGEHDVMLWPGLHHHYRGHSRGGFGAGGDVDLRRKSTGSVPPSEHSSGDNSDVDSVHSLPVSSTTPKPSVDKTSASSSCTPHTSYADIARMASSSSASSSSGFPPRNPGGIGSAGIGIHEDDDAIMVVCSGGDTKFIRENFVPDEVACPVPVVSAEASRTWEEDPVVIIFADGLECEYEARTQMSFGFEVNEQLLQMTLEEEGPPPEQRARDNVRVSVDIRFGQDPSVGRDLLREPRWASYVPGKEVHRFNYNSVVNYIGQSWEIVRREMDGAGGNIRCYSGDCM